MTDAGHTETPWQQGEKLGGNPLEIWSASGKHVVQVTKSPFGPYPDGPEVLHNAAFIVRAVNAHDDLVAALKEARVEVEASKTAHLQLNEELVGQDWDGEVSRQRLARLEHVLSLIDHALGEK